MFDLLGKLKSLVGISDNFGDGMAVPDIADLTGEQVQSQGADGQKCDGEQRRTDIAIVAGKQDASAHTDEDTGCDSQEKGMAHGTNKV